MLLDASGDDPIEIHIDSGDGDIDAAITLVDVIDLLGVPVHMVCVGRAVGPSLAVFAVGAPRLALPHARFRLCEPSASFDGPATAVGAWAEHRHAVLDRLCVRLGHATGRTSEEVRELMHRGEFWDAEAAREHGFVDEVAGPEARVLRFPRRIGFHPEP
jgi:ATP-dependent Clp protease protease subunit